MNADISRPPAGGELQPAAIARWVFRNILFLMVCTLVVAGIAAGISFLLPRSYEAKAILRPVVTDASTSLRNSLGNAMGGLGGVAGALLAGGPKTADDSTATMAFMRSPTFILSFITGHKLLPELYPDDWDAQAGGWKGEPPDMEAAVRRFLRLMTISKEENGLVELDMEWRDPRGAERVARDFIALVNANRKTQALAKADTNFDYLKRRLSQESTQEMRQTMANLASNELVKMMLSSGPGEYALETVVQPFAPKIPVSPSRTLITIMGAIVGFSLGLVALLVWPSLQRRTRTQ